MPVISINVAEVETLRAAMQRRVGDLSVARDRVRLVRLNLAVNYDDPAVHFLPDQLSAIEGRLQGAGSALDRQGSEVAQFVASVRALRAAGRARGPQGWSWSRMLAREAGLVRSSLPDLERALSTVLHRPLALTATVGAATFAVLRRSRQVVLRGVDVAKNALGDTFHRFVGDPIGRFVAWFEDRWARFRKTWAEAWAKFRTVVEGLRHVVQLTVVVAVKTVTAVVRTGVVLVQQILREVGPVWRTEFKKVPQRPGAKVTKEENYEGTFRVDVPLDEFGIPLNVALAPKLSAKVEHFDDGTVEVTLGQEFAAGFARAIGTSDLNPEAKAKLEGAVMAALGGERTYRIADTMIGDRPAYVVFLEQQVLRATLQGLVAMGGVGAPLAELALKTMAPAPDPVKSSAYLSVGAEVDLDLSVGGSGVKAHAEGKLTAKATVSDDGRAELEVSAELDAKGALTLLGVASAGADGKGTASFRIILDETGRPEAIEIEAAVDQRVHAGVKPSVENTVDLDAHRGTGTTTTVKRTVPITPELRARVGQLTEGLPGTAGQLVHELAEGPRTGSVSVESRDYTYGRVELELGAHASTGAGAEAKVSGEEIVYDDTQPNQGGR